MRSAQLPAVTSCHVQPDRGPQSGPRGRARQEDAGGGRGLGPEVGGREQEIQAGPGRTAHQAVPGPDCGADTAAGKMTWIKYLLCLIFIFTRVWQV